MAASCNYPSSLTLTLKNNSCSGCVGYSCNVCVDRTTSQRKGYSCSSCTTSNGIGSCQTYLFIQLFHVVIMDIPFLILLLENFLVVAVVVQLVSYAQIYQVMGIKVITVMDVQ